MINKHYKQLNRGAAMLIFVLFFAFGTSAMMFILGQSVFTDLSNFNRLTESKRAYLISESLTEDVVYRLTFGTFELDSEESLTLDGITAYATSTYDSPDDVYYIESEATAGVTIRKSQAEMSIGAGSAFNYGLQAGNGGITLSNNSSIFGNIYSNGTVLGAGSAEVFGDIVSAGPTGLIKTITATGSVYADTIDTVDADMDAYYNTALGTNNIAGNIFTPSANLPTTTMPISTTTIEEWEEAIDDYGTIIEATDPLCAGGTYELDISTTIGYLKVGCNLDIKDTGGGVTITMDGPVWVEGNLSFTQGPVINVDPSLGRRSTQFIVGSSTNVTTSSQIEIRNSTDFNGSGDDRSYILLMSLNESAELGGAEVGIDVGQSANGDVLVYADSGLIDIGNNIDLREVTAYQINVANGSSVTYEEGLASLVFTSGPGGAYVLSDWQQID